MPSESTYGAIASNCPVNISAGAPPGHAWLPLWRDSRAHACAPCFALNLREDSDVIGRPELPSISPPARRSAASARRTSRLSSRSTVFSRVQGGRQQQGPGLSRDMQILDAGLDPLHASDPYARTGGGPGAYESRPALPLFIAVPATSSTSALGVERGRRGRVRPLRDRPERCCRQQGLLMDAGQGT